MSNTIPEPTPEDDVIDKQERVEYVIDQKLAADEIADRIRDSSEDKYQRVMVTTTIPNIGPIQYAPHGETVKVGDSSNHLVVVPAGGFLEIVHQRNTGEVGDWTDDYPDLDTLMLTTMRIADLNGVVLPSGDQYQFNASRTDNVVDLPDSETGYAVAATTNAAEGFKVTLTDGGYYLIKAYAYLA